MAINIPYASGGGGGGNLPATSLNQVTLSVASGIQTDVGAGFGALTSSAISSTTLTNVINLPGPGYVTFLQLVDTGGTVSTPKVKVIIDGTVALNVTTATVFSSQSISIIGVYNNKAVSGTTGDNSGSEIPVYFNTSFAVEIAGDGVDSLRAAYKFILT